MSTSNNQGRALEYIVAKQILSHCTNINTTARAKKDQIRDKVYFDNLSVTSQNNYKKFAAELVEWCDNNHQICNYKELDRLPDSAAKKGDPTDIRLSKNGTDLNLSLKHNHNATKHQRPRPTAKRLGYANSSQTNKNFRASINDISDDFIKNHPGVEKFKELSPGVVDTEIYSKVIDETVDFFNQAHSPQHVQEYFSFLVGKVPYLKCVMREKSGKVQVYDYHNKFTLPNSFTATKTNNSHLQLDFDNGWLFDMRLHTASSRIQNALSLKFDTTLVSNNVGLTEFQF